MIIDSRNEFGSAVSVAAGVGTTVFNEKVIDMAAAGLLGPAMPDVYLVIQVHTTFDFANTTDTCQFTLASDDSAASFSTTTSSVHLKTKAYTEGELTEGKTLYVGKLPYASAETYERYLGLLCTLAGGTLSTGKVTAFLTPDPAAWVALADAV